MKHSYKYIPVEDYLLRKIIQMKCDNDLDTETVMNGALNCLAVYFQDEVVKTIVNDYYQQILNEEEIDEGEDDE